MTQQLLRELLGIDLPIIQAPIAGGALTPLTAAAESQESGDFTSLWSGQAAALGREIGATDLTRALVAEAVDHLGNLSGRS